MKNINTGCLEGATGWIPVSEFDEASDCFHQSALPLSDFIQVEGSPGAVCREDNVLCAPGEGTLLGAADSVLCHLDQSSPAGIVTRPHFTDDETEAENGRMA